MNWWQVGMCIDGTQACSEQLEDLGEGSKTEVSHKCHSSTV